MPYIDHIEKRIDELKLRFLNHAIAKYQELLRFCALPTTQQIQRDNIIRMMHSLNGSIGLANNLTTKHIASARNKRPNFNTEEAFNGELDMTFNEAQAEYFQLLTDINLLTTQ